MRDRPLPRIVMIATGLGLVPLLFGLALIIWPDLLPLDPVIVERAIIGYGAILLGFLGGIRWGVRILDASGSDMTFVLAASGALVGLIALLTPFSLAISMLIVGFAGQGAWDVWSGFKKTIPESYARARPLVTLITCLVLIAILSAYAFTRG